MQDRSQGLELRASGSGLKQVGVTLGLIFAITLAIVIGKRMSTEALAVVVGVVCGVAASIPTSLLLLVAISRRERQNAEEAWRRAGQGNQPPVVVIQGGSPQALPQGPQAGYWPAPAPGPPASRQFHVVGGDDLVLDEAEYRGG